MMSIVLRLAVLFQVLTAIAALTPEERADNILIQMNTTEKIAMMHGYPGTYIGNIVGNERLSIPEIKMNDGPQGFRTTERTGPDGSTTAWPAALTVASSWDKELVFKWGELMAVEFKGKGANVMLAPGLGIARVPTAGRNFEYMSGEDPVLGSVMAKSIIPGIQGQGVIANAKHWVNNEIETDRMRVSANVDEKTRFELYYPPFQAAVDAGVLSFMCAYNRINDIWACENENTMSHLKDTMGFTGWVMSDWTATRSTADAVKAGLDQELPYGLHFSEQALTSALNNGTIDISQIDDSVRRMLVSMFTIGLFDTEPEGDRNADVTSSSHNEFARKLAAQSTILLQNKENLLPFKGFSSESEGCIAVLGDASTVSGGGSGHVNPAYIVSPAEGVQNALDGMGATKVNVVYSPGTDLDEAAGLAQKCSYVVVNVATTSSEGSDRDSLSLGGGQDELVETVAKYNPNGTVVSVVAPGAVLMPWASSVRSVLYVGLPGQEAGNALADVLFGIVNPSARLPVTIPNKENEIQFTKQQFPGIGLLLPEAEYSEELLVGYRWYDTYGVTPAFPFGHGLSYTTFEYTALSILHDSSNNDLCRYIIHFTLRNTGLVTGSEVAQLYLAYPSSAKEPPKQLRAFSKITLDPEESTSAEMVLSARDFSIWDPVVHSWTLVHGEFTVYIASSSRDTKLVAAFTV